VIVLRLLIGFVMTINLAEIARINELNKLLNTTASHAELVKNLNATDQVQNELAKFASNSCVHSYAKSALEQYKNRELASQYLSSDQMVMESAMARINNYESIASLQASVQPTLEQDKYRQLASQYLSSDQAAKESAMALMHSLEYENVINSSYIKTLNEYAPAYVKDNFDEHKFETPIPHLPQINFQKNPLHETNQRLARLESMANKNNKSLKQINETAEDFTNNHSSNLIANKFFSRQTIFIAVSSLIVSVVGLGFTYDSYRDAKEASQKTAKEKVNIENKIKLEKSEKK
jgi:DNA repair ATPase RecN